MPLEGTEGDDGEEPKKKRARTELAEDEMPWGSLAAFALHKLFEEWQKDAALPLSGPTQEKVSTIIIIKVRLLKHAFGLYRVFTKGKWGILHEFFITSAYLCSYVGAG